MKKNRIVFLLLGIVVLGVFGFQILDSYGVFESNITSEASSDLAKWQILINGSNVTGQSNSFTVGAVNWTPNAGVVNGKAAPGSTGYFEIMIDPTGSEVSIEYEIEMDFLNLDNNMIYITSVEDEDLVPLTLVTTNVYSGMIPLSDILLEEIKTIRVDLVWENDDSNNEVDSVYVNDANPFLDIPISVRLSQYIQ